MVAPDDHRLVFISEAVAVIPPPGIIEHLKDRWWCVCPERGLIFWRADKKMSHPGAAQCNGSERVAEDFRARMYPWAQLKFFPSVFHRVNPYEFTNP